MSRIVVATWTRTHRNVSYTHDNESMSEPERQRLLENALQALFNSLGGQMVGVDPSTIRFSVEDD